MKQFRHQFLSDFRIWYQCLIKWIMCKAQIQKFFQFWQILSLHAV